MSLSLRYFICSIIIFLPDSKIVMRIKVLHSVSIWAEYNISKSISDVSHENNYE